jgi:heat shock protein HspQ
MSNEFLSSNDDDIFEDYVEETNLNTDYNSQSLHSEQEVSDDIFGDLDSSFSSFLKSSSVKVNFADSFYNAAHDWVQDGYSQSNLKAVLDTLTELTEGKFLYYHRLTSSSEILYRQKTILKFLNLILSEDNLETVLGVVSSDEKTFKKFNFNQEYFSMFFKSFYNLQMHAYKCEYAVYLSLCQFLETTPDKNLEDPLSEEITVLSMSDIINDLYKNHFQKDELGDLIAKNIKEILSKEE